MIVICYYKKKKILLWSNKWLITTWWKQFVHLLDVTPSLIYVLEAFKNIIVSCATDNLLNLCQMITLPYPFDMYRSHVTNEFWWVSNTKISQIQKHIKYLQYYNSVVGLHCSDSSQENQSICRVLTVGYIQWIGNWWPHTQRVHNLVTKLLALTPSDYLWPNIFVWDAMLSQIFFNNFKASKGMPRLRIEFFRIKF